MKPRRVPAVKKSTGVSFVSLFAGLVLGVAGAAAVVWYVNKMPAPFREPAPVTEKPAPVGEAPPLPGKPGDPPPERRFQFYDILPGDAEVKIDAPLPSTANAAPPKEEKPAAALPAKGGVFLQAGSFKAPDEADNQKARLAMQGFEAVIQQVMVQDKVWYRVRLGPYRSQGEADRARAELAGQGIETALVKGE